MSYRKIAALLVLTAALLLFGAGPSMAVVNIQCPPDTDGVDTDGDGIVDNDVVCLHLAAGDGFANMADGRLLYTFGFKDVTGMAAGMVIPMSMLGSEVPAPTITFREGQIVYLNLTNAGMMMRQDLFDPHTVHWHGYANAASIFDGVPADSVAINMGSTFTYYYQVNEPGTFIYHCHAEATEHMQMGMLGQLYVEAKQNMLAEGTDLNGFTHHTGYKYAYNDGDGSTYYDVDYPLQLTGFDPDFHQASIDVQPLPFAMMSDKYAMINGRGYPDTINTGVIANTFNGNESQKVNALIEATAGEKVLLRLSSLSTVEFFTLASPSIPMQVVGRGAHLLRGPTGENLYFTTNSLNLGGGEAMDVILDTTGVAPGTYLLYTTNLNYLSNDQEDFGGMMTEIVISAAP